MARNSGGRKKGGRPRGPSSDSQVLKTRSIDEVMGVEAIDFWCW